MPPTSRENPEQLPRIDGEIRNLRRFASPDTDRWSLFNPSIAQSPDGHLAMMFRSSNYVILEWGELHVTDGGDIRNRVYFCDLDDDLQIQNLRIITVPKGNIDTTRGLEDTKLFWRDGYWHFTATLMEKHTPVARMAVCRLNADAIEVDTVLVYDGWEPRKPEKNWMVPTVLDSSHFDFVYGPNAIVYGKRIIFTMSDRGCFTGLRGGSHLVEQEDGTYLAVMHKFWSKTKPMYLPDRFMAVTAKDKNYAHILVRFDRYGEIVEMSDPFQFISRGIEFAAGLIEHCGNLVISFGKADVSSHLCILPKDRALRMLHPLQP